MYFKKYRAQTYVALKEDLLVSVKVIQHAGMCSCVKDCLKRKTPIGKQELGLFMQGSDFSCMNTYANNAQHNSILAIKQSVFERCSYLSVVIR